MIYRENQGKLSKRAREKAFFQLTKEEIQKIKTHYQNIFSEEE
jgi:hypothetical protein